jgi:hypothetical protein
MPIRGALPHEECYRRMTARTWAGTPNRIMPPEFGASLIEHHADLISQLEQRIDAHCTKIGRSFGHLGLHAMFQRLELLKLFPANSKPSHAKNPSPIESDPSV